MADARSFMRFSTGLAVVAALAVPPASWAQAAKGKKGAPRMETEIEEITVVAQKREENIQEVPISVTALTSETLQTKGVSELIDIGKTAPNVRIEANVSGSSGTVVSIRGLTQANTSPAFQPAAGLYVDGVYLARQLGSNLDLEDLERVEVLRGPQGTLYGRNTIAGAANLITNKPTEERSITVRTEGGNFDYFKGRVTLNAPVERGGGQRLRIEDC